jgi:hypothetical protein
MIEVVKVSEQIMETAHRLQNASKTVFTLGQEKSHTEREYRIALMKEILLLKDAKMPATLISDISRGKVADLMFKRDSAEVQFKAALESMSALKSTLSAYQSILKFHEDL